MTDNIDSPNAKDTDNLRYDATLVAREIAKTNFTKKGVSKERQKHYEEVVRDPAFVKFMQSLASNNTKQQQVLNEPEANNNTLYAPVDYDNDFIPYKLTDNYIDHNGLRAELLNHINCSPDPILLIGDKGTGKTAVVHDIASDLYEKGLCKGLISMQGSYNTTDKHITGFNRLRGLVGETVKGFAVKMIELANYHAPDLVIGFCDEFPNMPADINIQFAPLLDGRRMIQTSDGKMWKLNKDARLSFICTGNPSHYAGVNQLQEALMSRMTGFYIAAPSSEQLQKVVDWGGFSDELRDCVLQLTQDIHALHMKGDVEYSISPRDLIQFTTEYSNRQNHYVPEQDDKLALCGALEKCILFKFQDTSERELVKRSIEDTFDITLVTSFS